jgi:hypothetical protein
MSRRVSAARFLSESFSIIVLQLGTLQSQDRTSLTPRVAHRLVPEGAEERRLGSDPRLRSPPLEDLGDILWSRAGRQGKGKCGGNVM